MSREIKINKKNLSLERRYEMRERRINMSPSFILLTFCVIVITGIILVCDLVLGILTGILGDLCYIAFLGFSIISMVCIELQMDYDEWKNKYIKRRINKHWRKHKRWLI